MGSQPSVRASRSHLNRFSPQRFLLTRPTTADHGNMGCHQRTLMTVQNSRIVELIEEAKTVGRQLCHPSSQLGCGTEVVTERGQDGRDHANDSHIGRVWLE